MILLDTSVLVYATGEDHPLREPSRDLIHAISEGKVRAATTPEVIQEFVHVRSRRHPRRDAASLGRSYAALLAPLVTVDVVALKDGLGVFERSKKVGSFDAVLAAVTIASQAEALVSSDRAFDEIRGLTRWDPAGPEIQELLARD